MTLSLVGPLPAEVTLGASMATHTIYSDDDMTREPPEVSIVALTAIEGRRTVSRAVVARC